MYSLPSVFLAVLGLDAGAFGALEKDGFPANAGKRPHRGVHAASNKFTGIGVKTHGISPEERRILPE
jgi:hypothetical protein